MKTRQQWKDEARLFISEMSAVEEEITSERVLEEVLGGWSDEVNYDGTPEEYAETLWSYIEAELEMSEED